MGFLSKIWNGVKKVAGAVAMIAAPFVAAPLAAAIGISGTIGTALVGAGVGALGASAAGLDPMIGAAVGGLGAFGVGGAAGGAGLGASAAGKAGLFGGVAGGAGAAGAAGAGAAGVAAAPAAAGLTTGAAGAAGAAAAGGGILGTGLTLGNLANLAPLAFAMFGRAPQDLTAEERALLERNAETAATERGLFNTQLEGARSLIQQGKANPERAFAEGKLAAQRGLRETQRTAAMKNRGGLQDAAERRAAIEGTRIGTAAVTGEQARAQQATSAGLSALPRSVPTTAEELNMAVYRDLYDRRNEYARDLASGFGQAFGSLT